MEHPLRKSSAAYAAHHKQLEAMAQAKARTRDIRRAEAKAASQMAANQVVDKSTHDSGI